MLLIWMSPRSYVEYFLPLNGSAAMLGAYAVSKARSKSGGFIVLMGLLVLLEFVFVQVIPADGFPYIGLRSLSASSEFWMKLGTCGGIAVGLAFVNFAMKKARLHIGRAVFIGITCICVCLWWNTSNIKTFADRVENIAARDSGPWQQAGLYIRNNSQEKDDTELFRNRREKRPAGLNLYGFGPGGLANISFDYFIVPKIAIEIGGGLRNQEGDIFGTKLCSTASAECIINALLCKCRTRW